MTVNTQRRMPGDHTMAEPVVIPATMSSATASGVVENGAASMPSVIFERTKPGRTTITFTPVPQSRSDKPWA